jgi:hypothetical protein
MRPASHLLILEFFYQLIINNNNIIAKNQKEYEIELNIDEFVFTIKQTC